MNENPNVCPRCGGEMPGDEIWEARRHLAGECNGTCDERGRCRAWSDSDLWTEEADESYFWLL
jgi:hypothetical protein